jgi:CelD/BcsL family acetyltransferase involved in cellulose biosynthesis
MTAAEVLTADEDARWRELLPARESVFGSVEFASIQRRHAGAEPRLFAIGAPDGRIALPLYLRSTDTLPFADRVEGALFDSMTPEYTGPLARRALDPAARTAFAEALARWCADTGIVTEFEHLHPWKARTELLDPAGLEPDREIVYVDLTQDEERMWRESFTHACRKNIKRARREGVRVRDATSEVDARELHRIYALTMDRQGALERYHLPPEYFVSFLERLPDNSRILLAEHEGRVIAATLYLHDDDDAYSYLGGADHDFQRVRPTNAIVDEMIRWARGQGKRRLVLGGGYAPGDGIFRFKSSFSPLRAEFRVYRHVHLPDAYAALGDAWRDHYGTEAEAGFFPPYRAVPAQSPR